MDTYLDLYQHLKNITSFPCLMPHPYTHNTISNIYFYNNMDSMFSFGEMFIRPPLPPQKKHTF